MAQVVYRSDILTSSGYAHSSRLYVLGLIESGVDVKLIDYPGNYEDYLRYLTPYEAQVLRECIQKPLKSDHVYYNRTPWNIFKPFPSAKKQIATSLWEATPLPHPWRDGINNSNIDMILTHSKFNQELFETEITKPVKLIREGINLDLYKDIPIERNMSGTFNFLSVFQWVERKGYDTLLEAFYREFTEKDNVSLIIKTNSLDYNHVSSSAILSYISSFKYRYRKNLNVYAHTTHTTDDMIMNLYSNSHCFVLPTKGEGVCRPALEAMACNLPIIITGWSGQTDFCKDDNSYLINYQMQPVRGQWYAGEFNPSYVQWAEPDILHLQKLMRHVYENYNEAKEKAKKAKEDIKYYDYRLVGKDLKEVLFS